MLYSALLGLAFAQTFDPDTGDDCAITGPTAPNTAFCWWVYNYPWQDNDAAATRAGDASWCDQAANDNTGTWPLNPECNNAGTCKEHNAFQSFVPAFTWGKCECANTAQVGNFVHNDDRWVFQIFEGDQCDKFDFLLFATLTYLIRVPTWASSSATTQGISGMLECDVGSDGAGVTFVPETQTGLAIPDLTPMVSAVLNYPEYWGTSDKLWQYGYTNYAGSVVPWRRSTIEQQHCKVCSNSATCEIGGTVYGDEGAGGYLMVSFATNFNTYYNASCEKAATINMMPTDQAGATNLPNCDANFDGGFSASHQWAITVNGNVDPDGLASHHKSHYLELAQQPTATPVFDCSNAPTMSTPCTSTDVVYGLGWTVASGLQITRTDSQETKADGLATDILSVPTVSPTMTPTKMPTPSPTAGDVSCFDAGYTHQPSDLQFAGIAEAGDRGCRWGLETSWPGGDTPDMCDSPYVVCLPEENTSGPNAGFPLNDGTSIDPYPANNAPYTIEMCTTECAYDQRCNGFEFVATGEVGGVKQGTCKLIDDLPVALTSPGGTSANPSITTQSDLDAASWDSLNGAICYEKNVGCNPYFGADDLNDVMLKCYCPNNRKGFYTKNVKRTVAATKFCDETQTDVTDRIKNAQANRMFHLCENWCLFNTQNPRTEMWYHDPWEECWREQYAGIGTHRSYCYRVIRDPFTIEQYFIDQRSQNMCPQSDDSLGFGNNQNTPSPVYAPGDVSLDGWYLANSEDSCDDACEAEGLDCNYEETSKILNDVSDPAQYFTAAGYDCQGNFEQSDEVNDGYGGSTDAWALPAVGPGGECILRHPNANTADLMAGCNVAVGFNYRRLCACGSVG